MNKKRKFFGTPRKSDRVRVNLYLGRDIVIEAKKKKFNLSAIAERALREQVGA